MLLTMANTRLGFTARLQTPYINTTGMCIEIFFRATSASIMDAATVSIVAVSEDNFEEILVASDGTEPNKWNRLFSTIPNGAYQVVIEGRRSISGFSSLVVDDVTVQECIRFGTHLLQNYVS
jgi:MAM domain, meprin/A5/mu